MAKKQKKQPAAAAFRLRLETLISEGRSEGLDEATLRKMLKAIRKGLKQGGS